MALQPGSPARNSSFGSIVVSDQRGFPLVGPADIGAYEAGTPFNYNVYIWETLPASATVSQHDANADYDGDGVSNFNEYLAGTNPGDPTSYLHITQGSLSGSTITLTFPSVTGRQYSVEGSTDLSTWLVIDSSLSGNGSPITQSYVFTNGAPPALLPPRPRRAMRRAWPFGWLQGLDQTKGSRSTTSDAFPVVRCHSVAPTCSRI